MPKEEIFGYHWAGTRLGNTYTCNAQGFFALFGMTCMYNYNAMLCVYYACAIAFTMRERNIKKHVEPILHIYPVLVSLAVSLPPLFYEMYNPGITAYPWCGPFPYPDECAVLDGVPCIRGDAQVRDTIQLVLPVMIVLLIINISLPLALVIRKVVQTDHVLDQISKIYDGYHDNTSMESMKKILEKHRNTKAVLVQAISYISGFLLGFIPPLIMSSGLVKSGDRVTIIFTKLFIFFLPLQGFFNCIIFIAHKVYNYRRVNSDVSICGVFVLLFRSSSHDPFFISRISVVKQHHEEIYDFEIMDEDDVRSKVYNIGLRDGTGSNEELRFRLELMNSGSFSSSSSSSEESSILLQDEEDGTVKTGGDEPDTPSAGLSTAPFCQEEGRVVEEEEMEGSLEESRCNISDAVSSSNSSWFSYPSRSSLNISLRRTDLSMEKNNEEEADDADNEKYYYRNVEIK
jgi:hypothetical protein